MLDNDTVELLPDWQRATVNWNRVEAPRKFPALSPQVQYVAFQEPSDPSPGKRTMPLSKDVPSKRLKPHPPKYPPSSALVHVGIDTKSMQKTIGARVPDAVTGGESHTDLLPEAVVPPEVGQEPPLDAREGCLVRRRLSSSVKPKESSRLALSSRPLKAARKEVDVAASATISGSLCAKSADGVFGDSLVKSSDAFIGRTACARSVSPLKAARREKDFVPIDNSRLASSARPPKATRREVNVAPIGARKKVDVPPFGSSRLGASARQLQPARCNRDVPSFNLDEYVVDAHTTDWLEPFIQIFTSSGFCICTNVLSHEAYTEVLKTCRATERNILQHDPDLKGNRDPGRYSFGAVARTKALVHEPAWRYLLDNSVVLNACEYLFPDGFAFFGGGGDFVVGNTSNYQALHSDLSASRVPHNLRHARAPPRLVVNFTVQEISYHMGPMRLIPGRKVVDGINDLPPVFSEETPQMKESKLCPLPAGAAIFRDLRTWHGGTPNMTPWTRFLPSVEVISGPYLSFLRGEGRGSGKNRSSINQCLPVEQFLKLSTRCQERCREILARRRLNIGILSERVVQPQRTWEKGAGRGMKTSKRKENGLRKGNGSR